MEVETYICPGCGSELRIGTRGCPKCNARARRKRARVAAQKGWEQSRSSDGLDLPDEDFDYQSFVSLELGKPPHRKIGIRWYWWLTAAVLLVVFLAFCLRVAV